MRRGLFRRTLRWRSASGQTLDIIAERLAAMDEPGLLAMRYQVISVDYQGPITLESSIDAGKAPVEQGDDPRIGAQIEGGLHLVASHADERSAWVMQRTTHSDISLVCAQRHRVIEGDLAIGACMPTPRGVVQMFSGTLAPGQGVSIEKNVGYAWTAPGGGSAAVRLHALAEAVLDRAGAMGFPALLVQTSSVGLFLILHAFASGGAAMTGVEAISNGVPAFRPVEWKNARNTLCRHFGKQSREVDTVDLADVPDRLVKTSNKDAGMPAFEFYHWMAFLYSREREALTLRFIEQWEYHEIAAAQSIPIGTVQWRVFSAKRKLAPHLKRVERNDNSVTPIAA